MRALRSASFADGSVGRAPWRGALLLTACLPLPGCTPLCMEFGAGTRSYSAEGDVWEVDGEEGTLIQEPAGDTWQLMGYPGRLEHNGEEVRDLARFVHAFTLVDGQAALVEGRPPELYLPADAAPVPVPNAPKGTQAAALAGTEAALWVAGLGPKSEGQMAPWVTTRTDGAWRTDTPPDLAASSAEVLLAATEDRVAMLTPLDWDWRLAERVDGAWSTPAAVDGYVEAAVYGGDGQLWLLAARELYDMVGHSFVEAGAAGSVFVIRPGGCEAALGELAWPAAMETTEAGVAVLAITVDGEVKRFDVSGECEVSSQTLAAPAGQGFEASAGAVSGEAAFLLGTWWVGRDGGGFSYPQYECY